jgi:cytochrome P450
MAVIAESPEIHALLDELTTAAGRADPYPRYDKLRRISPIVRAVDQALVVTHYTDCTTVARDPRFAHMSPDMLAFAGFPEWSEHPALYQLFTSLLVRNPPDHTRLRRWSAAPSPPAGCRRCARRSSGWSTTCSTR